MGCCITNRDNKSFKDSDNKHGKDKINYIKIKEKVLKESNKLHEIFKENAVSKK
jgi:hypothetical protein